MRLMRRIGGFTLIELMIVVAILGLLALIAVPRFGQLIRKSNEAATRGHMGSVRSAVSIYYSGNEGLYPTNLSPFLLPGSPYALANPPVIYTADHGTSRQIDLYAATNPFLDTGFWAYVSRDGVFWAACFHRDVAGKVWSEQ